MNNSTLFVDYMEIISDYVEEEGKKKDEDEAKDAEKKSANSVEFVKSTVHNVYIKRKMTATVRQKQKSS